MSLVSRPWQEKVRRTVQEEDVLQLRRKLAGQHSLVKDLEEKVYEKDRTIAKLELELQKLGFNQQVFVYIFF